MVGGMMFLMGLLRTSGLLMIQCWRNCWYVPLEFLAHLSLILCQDRRLLKWNCRVKRWSTSILIYLLRQFPLAVLKGSLFLILGKYFRCCKYFTFRNC